MKYLQKLITTGYLLIFLLIGGVLYLWHKEWQDI